jgi:cytidyltransferase-like protein
MSTQKKVVAIASGYFNIVHPGHVDYLEKSKSMADELIVIVNNDYQFALKYPTRPTPVMCEVDRARIVGALRCVDKVVVSQDMVRSVSETIKNIYMNVIEENGGSENVKVLFTNGGDQFNERIPESDMCNSLGIFLVDGLGEKTHASSTLCANIRK